MDLDFEDDFIDDSDEGASPFTLPEEEEAPEEPKPAPEEDTSPPIEEEENNESLPPEVVNDVSDVFAATEKVNALNMSLKRSIKLSNTETNQLYSLLFCVYQDCELLLARNRPTVPFSIQSECAKNREIKLESGLIKHKKFVDGFNANGISKQEEDAMVEFFEFKRSIIERGLGPVVASAVKLLQDPLIRSHNRLRTMKQKIGDLKKSNLELSLQTRQTANRLVRLSKNGKDVDLQGNTDKSDVIIHQQRLQKALSRVYNLRDANELTMAANSELQAKISQEATRVPKKEEVSPQIVELQARVSALNASVEQSEEERETAMAQRRVSIARMNAAIKKLELEIARAEEDTEEVDNKTRIMTQGHKEGGNEKRTRDVKKAAGSRIPVFSHDKSPIK